MVELPPPPQLLKVERSTAVETSKAQNKGIPHRDMIFLFIGGSDEMCKPRFHNFHSLNLCQSSSGSVGGVLSSRKCFASKGAAIVWKVNGVWLKSKQSDRSPVKLVASA